jgi:hypothetical protein
VQTTLDYMVPLTQVMIFKSEGITSFHFHRENHP